MTCCLRIPVLSSSEAKGGAPRGLLLLGALLSTALPLAAHDHWIAPSSFHPAPGERVDLCLRAGHPAQFEEQLRDPRRALRFEVLGPAGAKPVPGLDGKSPAGIWRPREEGVHVVVYRSNHALAELEAGKYAEFLASEGLDDVLAERERRGESALPGRDSYARFDKTLVRVGGGSSAGYERVAGLPLELSLETDPFTWTGGELVLRLDFEGQPLEGRQIKLVRLERPHLVLLARTDEHGRVRLRPESGGPWCAFAVHQRRATEEQGLEGDWEGFWASLAFPLGDS
jgi:uncharacterized protein DUF4198